MFPEKLDPWMLLAVPVFYVMVGALSARQALQGFITRWARTKY